MPRPRSTKAPAYTLHKPSGKARVRLNGRDIYLGTYDTPESREAYHKLIAEWERQGRAAAPATAGLTVRETKLHAEQQAHAAAPDVSVNEIMLGYVKHCREHYANRRTFKKAMAKVNTALAPLKRAYGLSLAASFGPRALRDLRRSMLTPTPSNEPKPAKKRGGRKVDVYARAYVNDQVRIIRAMFQWAASEELIPASVWHGLQAVKGLRSGESKAREPKKVQPVPQADVDAVLPRLSRQLAAVARLQLLTGARPGEILSMRMADIDMSGAVWIFRPATHKGDAHDHQRIIALGPQAQKIVREFVTLDREKHLFSPADAQAARLQALREARKAALYPSEASRRGKLRKRNAKRRPGSRYTTASYGYAVRRACLAVGVPVWGVHRLRHNHATAVRKRFGIEAAQAVLGHAHVNTSELYAAKNEAIVADIARKIG